MNYEEIYSRFLSRAKSDKLLELSPSDFNSVMRDYLHDAASQPMIRKLFSELSLDDEVQMLSYVLKDSVDEESDYEFVADIFAQELVILWMRHNLDTDISLSLMIGGKEEKVLKNDLSANISRVDSLEYQLQRTIRNHGYYNDVALNG